MTAKAVEKSVLGSVRLDSDVWDAVREMECSLNQYLRSNLLGEMRYAKPSVKGTISVEGESATVNLISGGGETVNLDAVSENRGKATIETLRPAKRLPVESWRRGPRQKGDTGR
jgi:hypothetical protein